MSASGPSHEDDHSSSSDDNDSSSSDDELEHLSALLANVLEQKQRLPYQIPALPGTEYMRHILEGPPVFCYNVFRMHPHTFRALCGLLRTSGYIDEKKNKFVSLEESVGIFLYVVAHRNTHRGAADRFPHSLETINTHFKIILKALAHLAPTLIQLPNGNDTPPEIACNPQLYPWFENAIGAIDGTLVDAWAPRRMHNVCRSRKGNISQNVMAACSFDMMFTFVYSGWEGSANDSRVLLHALRTGLFPRPPQDKYYLVDCGYSNMPGFLAPYRGERYHLQEFRGNNNGPTGPRELFNRRHSSLRNVIERTFGVLKARFPILKQMTNFKQKRQAMLVTACCVLHNFIRMHSADDLLFTEYTDESFVAPIVNPEIPVDLDMSQNQLTLMSEYRDQIAMAMWNDYTAS